MTKWTLVLAAALLVPSVAHADVGLGICYSDRSCTNRVSENELDYGQCIDAGGLSWWADDQTACLPI